MSARTEDGGRSVDSGDQLNRSEYSVPKMDCPSEERTIRLVLDGDSSVHALSVDLSARRLTVWHEADSIGYVTERLGSLGLGAELLETRAGADAAEGLAEAGNAKDSTEARTLWLLLGINGSMFVVELVGGLLVASGALLADSLDMLADAVVYGLSLYAVGRTAAHKVRAAHFSGALQLVLALGALLEVARRALQGSEPEPGWMMGVAVVALAANLICLALIHRHRGGGVHMKASYIFSTNDVLANVGVIAAGGLVAVTGSRFPDLVVGGAISLLVLSGAVRILRLR